MIKAKKIVPLLYDSINILVVYTIFRQEFRSYFTSVTGYIAIGLFVLAVSLFLWVIPGSYNVFDSGYANLDGMFAIAPWLFMLLCPAITMRLIAEERQRGTWDLLFSRPLTLNSIVIGKYVAAWTVCLIALLPCLLHYVVLYYIAQPIGNVDGGAFAGAMLGLVFLAATFCAIGLFASALSSSQITAFIIASVLCFILYYGFDLIASMIDFGVIAKRVSAIGFNEHFKSISRGVIDSADVVYFMAVTIFFIISTEIVLSRRK